MGLCDGLLPCRLESGGARRAARVIDSGSHSARLAATHPGTIAVSGHAAGSDFLAARHDVHLLRRAGHGRDAQTAGVDGRGAGVLDGEPAAQSGDAGVYGFCSGLAVCAGSPGGGSGDSINCGDAGAEMGERGGDAAGSGACCTVGSDSGRLL